MYYRKELSRLLLRKERNHSPKQEKPFEFSAEAAGAKDIDAFEPMPKEDSTHTDYQQDFESAAQDCADEIQAYTLVSTTSIDKDELITNLRKILHKYPFSSDSDQQHELNDLIAIYSQKNCSIHLSADELSELWKG